jgi:hypothetical protein
VFEYGAVLFSMYSLVEYCSALLSIVQNVPSCRVLYSTLCLRANSFQSEL